MFNNYRRYILLSIDTFIIFIGLYASSYLIKGEIRLNQDSILAFSVLVLFFYLFAFQGKLYRKAWEYASVGEMLLILKIVALTSSFTFFTIFVFFQQNIVNIISVASLLCLFLIGGSRFCWRLYRDNFFQNKKLKKRTMIIGAGDAGRMIARQLKNDTDSEFLHVVFIDDNGKKHKLEINGIPVVGGREVIQEVVEKMKIEHVIIAIPSLKKKELQNIFLECAKTKAITQALPKIEDIVSGKVKVNEIRDVQVEDLLGREEIGLDIESIATYVTNKTVLVTGAGGSIGSEICRQLTNFNPKKLILLGHGENSIYSIEMELKGKSHLSNIQFITEIADVQDESKMLAMMAQYKPDVVYHAAAHKHVPLMERNPEEAIKNNIIGTKNVAYAAHLMNVSTFVMVSTDKAVNPTSVMGASKRLAEMIVQHMDQKSMTKFVTVRFGNVLGSRGSVVPLFKKQIEQGGPVTVTHPDMQRYFMTIPEASRLVIQAGALASGGEILILDMGEPVKIVDLAINLIKLSGYTIEDIGITFSGIRPGEKLYEELLHNGEELDRKIHPKIYIGKCTQFCMDEIENIIQTYNERTREELRQLLVQTANQRVGKIQTIRIPG